VGRRLDAPTEPVHGRGDGGLSDHGGHAALLLDPHGGWPRAVASDRARAPVCLIGPPQPVWDARACQARVSRLTPRGPRRASRLAWSTRWAAGPRGLRLGAPGA